MHTKLCADYCRHGLSGLLAAKLVSSHEWRWAIKLHPIAGLAAQACHLKLQAASLDHDGSEEGKKAAEVAGKRAIAGTIGVTCSRVSRAFSLNLQFLIKRLCHVLLLSSLAFTVHGDLLIRRLTLLRKNICTTSRRRCLPSWPVQTSQRFMHWSLPFPCSSFTPRILDEYGMHCMHPCCQRTTILFFSGAWKGTWRTKSGSGLAHVALRKHKSQEVKQRPSRKAMAMPRVWCIEKSRHANEAAYGVALSEHAARHCFHKIIHRDEYRQIRKFESSVSML